MKKIEEYTHAEILDAAKRAFEHVKAHPEEWDQHQWHCGTVACLGGWMDVLLNLPYYGDANGTANTISTIAARVHIFDIDGDSLFYAGNSLDDLEQMLQTATVFIDSLDVNGTHFDEYMDKLAVVS
jgi:hypothetical protein